jgi:hypothetical protein
MASSASMEQCTVIRSVFRPKQHQSSSQSLTLDGWQTEFLCNLGIPDLGGVLQRHSPHQLSQVTRTRNRAAAAKGLELDIADGVVGGIHPDLELHNVATGRRTDESRANVGVGL